jgi:integrase
MAQIAARTRSDGQTSYQVRWRLGGVRDGLWQAETFTREERARAFKLDVEDAGHFWPKGWIKGEGYVQRSISERLFADVADDYFNAQARRITRGRVQAYTVHRYRATYDLHLKPAFGDEPFSAIVPDQIADWIDELVEAAYRPKTVKNFHGLLFSIMAHGQKRLRLRADNPCEVTELPEDSASDARQVRFFQHGEWALFRACLKQDAHLLVDVLLSTGIRWGEVSALRVSDITFPDDDTAVMHIARAWSKRAPEDTSPIRVDEDENPTWRLGPPKNKHARYVVAKGEVARRLREAIAGHKASAYVFLTRYGNPWRYQDFYSDRWLPARHEAEKRGLTKHATPHMLRHTTVVWSLAQGVPIQVISEMLGHASIQITYDVYGGLIDMRDPAMAQAMAAAMTTVKTAIVPAPSREEVEARPVRPGARGVSRRRAG